MCRRGASKQIKNNIKMKEEAIVFVKQLLNKLEQNVSLLEGAKEENDPRSFNDYKKNSFDVHQEIEKLIEPEAGDSK
jgi:hypothetical protein